ncbi:Hypothetical protein CINCED_3A018660, partial [Cinara cedri]
MEHSISELTHTLRKWEEELQSPNFDPTPTLLKLCELFETESKNYLKKDPDPFDNRHPLRIDPTCVLGQMYKILFRKDVLMNSLVMVYLKDNYWARRPKDNHELNVTACRLMMSLIPGLETTVVFESPANDELIHRLFFWAQTNSEPLQTYATGLLATSMELPDIAANFKEYNSSLVPLVLDRLQSYYTQIFEEIENIQPFSHPNNGRTNNGDASIKRSPNKKMRKKSTYTPYTNDAIVEKSSQNSKMSIEDLPNETKESGICGDSNSSWVTADTITSHWVQIYPLTLTTKIVYCLKYLVPIGEYQEFLCHAYEKNSLYLVMKIISTSDKQNGYLTFEALKYLASLLCHKKIATEFVCISGLQKILTIPRPSIPSTGVSICFYYLSYCEEAMERICLLPDHILIDLVKYALWMLECSHDSSRCHATMFFSYSFHYRVIQEIFDSHDGLRKLINVISTLPLLSSEDSEYSQLNEDAECSARQTIRHVCAGLKHYFEAHLHIKAQIIRRTKIRDSGLTSSFNNIFPVPGYKSNKKSQTEVYEEIELVSNEMSLKSHWSPVDKFIKLGGLNIMLQIISMAHDWNIAGRCEMIRNALEVINICAVLPRVQLALCEPAPKIPGGSQNDESIVEEDPQSEYDIVGLNIILKAADGDLLDADIQKAALCAIITCVCAPIHREGGIIAYYSAHGSAKKRPNKTNDDVIIEKIWDCIRNNNGIM